MSSEYRVEISRNCLKVSKKLWRYSADIFDGNDKQVDRVKADFKYVLLRRVRKAIKENEKTTQKIGKQTVRVRM